MAKDEQNVPKKTLAEHAKSIAALPGEKLAELKAYGSEKLQETMSAFLRALPALRQAGHELREFEIELGLTPRIIAHFMPAPTTEADIVQARDALGDNKVGASMLGVLTRAGAVHRQINVPGFHCAHIEIDVGVLPAVRLRYRADDPGA
jgi:hypothetical protein